MRRNRAVLGGADDEFNSGGSRTSTDRLVSFSDAVVAIALTLIVLPIVDVASEPDATVSSLVHDDGYRLASAAVTFLIIGSIWREHHVAFERTGAMTRNVVGLNLMWLATVIFLPVPTALLFTPDVPASAQDAAVGLYAATAAAAAMLMRLIDKELQRFEEVVPGRASWQGIAKWVYPGLLVCASVLAFSGLGLRAMFVVLLAVPVQWVFHLWGQPAVKRKRTLQHD